MARYNGEIRCGGCDEHWKGLDAAHCSVCHRSFTSRTGFDRHRTGPVDQRRCVDPPKIGYELKPLTRGQSRGYEIWGRVNREGEATAVLKPRQEGPWGSFSPDPSLSNQPPSESV